MQISNPPHPVQPLYIQIPLLHLRNLMAWSRDPFPFSSFIAWAPSLSKLADWVRPWGWTPPPANGGRGSAITWVWIKTRWTFCLGVCGLFLRISSWPRVKFALSRRCYWSGCSSVTLSFTFSSSSLSSRDTPQDPLWMQNLRSTKSYTHRSSLCLYT